MSEPTNPQNTMPPDQFSPPELECPEGCTPAPGDCLSALDEDYQDAMEVYSDTLTESMAEASEAYFLAMAGCAGIEACEQAAADEMLAATEAAMDLYDSQKQQLDETYIEQATEQCCECEGEDE